MKSKRPWRKHAAIERIEFNSGDVKFRCYTLSADRKHPAGTMGEFESLVAAETLLDDWWMEFWPKQVKSRRPA